MVRFEVRPYCRSRYGSLLLLGGLLLGSVGTLIISLLPRDTAWPVIAYCLVLATIVLGLSCVSRAKTFAVTGSMMRLHAHSAEKHTKSRSLGIWQVVAQQIAAADPKPLRGFGQLSSSVGRQGKNLMAIESSQYFSPLLFFGTFAHAEGMRERFWRKFFSEFQAKGTIVVADERQTDRVILVFDQVRSEKRYSPASTFKIPHTLFALDAGAARDEFQVFRWDGIKEALQLTTKTKTCDQQCGILLSGFMSYLQKRSVKTRLDAI